MSKLVRVKLPATGAHTTVSEAYAKRHGLTPLNSPTHDRHGRIRPRVMPKAKPDGHVDASMTREDLEAAATAAGVPTEAIAAAKNKGQLVDAITNHQENAGDQGDSDETTEA